jgi:general nucleoside transport system ATP-binding protein
MDQHTKAALNAAPIIRLNGIAKRFGNTWANLDINVSFQEGEIHALVGENGAGKSTLLKLLFGHLQPDRGTIYWRSQPVIFRHPLQAQRTGIGMVHQHTLIFPQLSTLENIMVGAEPSHWGWLCKARARLEITALCQSFGFDFPLDRPATELAFSHRQQVEIVRMLYRGAKLLLLDEPTSLLAPSEITRLLELLRNLKAQGHTIVFVSHRIEEVFAIADRISVLIRGRIPASYATAAVSVDQIAQLILSGNAESVSPAPGPPIIPASQRKPEAVSKAGQPGADPKASPALPLLVLHEISTQPSGHDASLINLSIAVMKPGDVVGIGGIVGNGLRTLAQVLAGVLPVTHGRITFQGEDITALTALQRAQRGFRWLHANPLEETLLPVRPLWENVLLGRQRCGDLQSYGVLRKSVAIDRCKELLSLQEVRFDNVTQPLDTLSGGNQQKVALARIFADRPHLVVLEQPGHGLDLRAQRKLVQRVRALSAEGVIFVVLSYDLDELLMLSQRVGILFRGRLMGLVPKHQAHREQLGAWMLGLEPP